MHIVLVIYLSYDCCYKCNVQCIILKKKHIASNAEHRQIILIKQLLKIKKKNHYMHQAVI